MAAMVKILVIEEEAGLLEAYRSGFERDGYRVVATASTVEGLSMMDSASPDLVILDEANRDMNCIETIGQLTSHCPRIPVLLSSDPTSPAHRLACRVADAAIPRSSDTFAIRSQVRKLLAPDAA
jgi:DNA-binding response OmpR family regulator